MLVWRILHDFGLYPFHMQTVWALQPTNIARVEFRHWLLGNWQLRTKILFTDEATLNRWND